MVGQGREAKPCHTLGKTDQTLEDFTYWNRRTTHRGSGEKPPKQQLEAFCNSSGATLADATWLLLPPVVMAK